MSDELLPCPFCGGPAACIERPALSGRYVAACASSNCVMQHQIMAPETWNRRAPAPAQQGVGQRLPEPNPPLDQVATQGVGAAEHSNRRDDALRAESAALRAELERVRGERDRAAHLLRKLAAYWVGDIWLWWEDAPEHECEYVGNPESGYCSVHEMWADIKEVIANSSAAALVITETPTEEGGEDE